MLHKKGLVHVEFCGNLVKFFKPGNLQNASAAVLKVIGLPETKICYNSFCKNIMLVRGLSIRILQIMIKS